MSSAGTIANAVGRGDVSAREVVDRALERIEAANGALNAFTTVTGERARARADASTARARPVASPAPSPGCPSR